MTDETKQLLQIQLSMLKKTMFDNGVIFAMGIDEKDKHNSCLYFMDKYQYFHNGKMDGFNVSLTELNKGLV